MWWTIPKSNTHTNNTTQHGYSWYTPYTYIEKLTSRARCNVDRKISLMPRD